MGGGGQHGEVQDEGVVDDQGIKGVERYGGQQREVRGEGAADDREPQGMGDGGQQDEVRGGGAVDDHDQAILKSQ